MKELVAKVEPKRSDVNRGIAAGVEIKDSSI
jgi:hypothetical protein